MNQRTADLATIALAALAAVVVWDLSTWLFPYHSLNHDEAVYLQQAAMLLEGQLNLWPPVDGAFRPWFFVEDGDRLYPKYSPVPAAFFAIGRLLGGYRIALAGVAAANVALVSLVVRAVFDDRTGLLAAGFVLVSPLFLVDSAVFLPYAPTTMLNLAFAYAYLRADRGGGWRWGAGAGVAIGTAFFARPYTAVLFAAPFVAHAAWTLRRDREAALSRQVATAATGLFGVAVALGYNAAVTGSPRVFPYEAFAPLDGIGFGYREILGYGVDYTPELAIRANWYVVDLFFSEWFAGGLLGTAFAAVGLLLAAHRGLSAREATLGGLFVSVIVGNVYFWGNYNVLGKLDVAGDGLVAVLGPYYHFDLLLPTAAFAAFGGVRVADGLRRTARESLDPRRATVAVGVVLLVCAGAVGAVAVDDLGHRVEENMDVTETYEVAYEPFEGGPPENSLILLPTPYGDWLNHPFQPLRNDPGFDGRAVYAIDDRPFAVADAFPERDLYRYSYRGSWAPFAGSPRASRLERVRDVSGRSVHLDATVGVPEGAVGVTVRVATDDGSAYYVAPGGSDRLDLRLTVADGIVDLAGDVRPVGPSTIPVEGRDTVVLTVFVDYGAGDGVTYRFDLPVEGSAEGVRALSPRVEFCRAAQTCGGSAAYVPDAAPDGVFARTELLADEHNP